MGDCPPTFPFHHQCFTLLEKMIRCLGYADLRMDSLYQRMVERLPEDIPDENYGEDDQGGSFYVQRLNLDWGEIDQCHDRDFLMPRDREYLVADPLDIPGLDIIYNQIITAGPASEY